MSESNTANAATSGRGSSGNVIAAALSFFFPGVGQLTQGKILPGLSILVFVGVAYFFWFLILPPIAGFLVHIWAVYDAATYRPGH